MRGDDTWHFLSLGEMFPQCLWGETDREVNTEEPEVGAISVSSVMHTRTHRDEWTEVSVVLVWLKPQGDRTGCVEQSMTSASLPSPPAESHRLQGFRDTYPVSANIFDMKKQDGVNHVTGRLVKKHNLGVAGDTVIAEPTHLSNVIKFHQSCGIAFIFSNQHPKMKLSKPWITSQSRPELENVYF